ncbi:MAG: restriction endonuclease subunit S [Bacteroidales bacterium]|nr:restriction endonuclease subunit S [Bacteroidales bacterium]
MKDLIQEITMGPFGSDIKVDNFIADGVPVLNGSNVTGVKLTEESFKYVSEAKAKSLKKANTKRGDIVITHRGTLGQISYIPENSKFDNYIISQSQFRVTLKRNLVDPIFFTYYFHSSEGQKRLLSFKNHVGVPALAQATTNFRLLEFPYKPIEEQKKIAKVLSDLDAKIELNIKINQELEAMAKLLYDYWFVQFDFPNEQGKPYKSSGGKMVYDKKLNREIPEGWEVKKLKHYLKHNYNSISKSNNYNQIKYLDTSSLTQNYISSLQNLNCETDKIPSRAQRIVTKNDILYSTVRPNQCHYGIIKEPNENMIASTGFAQLSSKEQGLSNDLIYTFITSYWVTKRLQKIAELSVSAYPSISPTDILELRIALPKDKSINLLKSINKQLDNSYNLINYNQKQNQQLTKLRDWLLPMLMNGQVTVGAAEEKLNMAAEPSGEYKIKGNE